MEHKTQQRPAAGNEFAILGARLVRFGQALQDHTTSVGHLSYLAKECGITLRLRAVADEDGNHDKRN